MAKKMVVVAVALLLAVGLWGQGSSTMYQTVFTTATSATPAFLVRNQGQNLHQVFMSWTNAPGQVCTNSVGLFWVNLEGSFDYATWDVIASLSVTGGAPKNRNGILARSIFGRGAYPYVQVRIVSSDDVACRINAWYSGNISGQNREVPVYDSIQENPDVATTSVGSTAIGDTTLIPAIANYKITIYGLTVSNNTAAQTAILKCSGGGELLRLYNMIAGQTVIWPNTGRAHAFCGIGEGLVLNLTAATPVALSIKSSYF